ncbi:MAG: maltotransferase domain-containing protein, partial [Chthoniobacterales bacterium]
MPDSDTVVIEHITPILDCGRYAVKRKAGDDLVVEADIFKDGHDIVAAVLKWRKYGETAWQETQMLFLENDRWQGVFPLLENAMYEYTIEAWGDVFASWCHEIHKKFDAGIRDLKSEAQEGVLMISDAAERSKGSVDTKLLSAFAANLGKANAEDVNALSLDSDLLALMAVWPGRTLATEVRPPLKAFADRERAVFAAWYEFFPRSAQGSGDKGSTFRDCLGRIDDAKAMGFDVIYFPPVHPIGVTNRKGRNNSLKCEKGEPGV